MWLSSASFYYEVAGMLSFFMLYTLPYNIINLQDIQPAIQYLIPGMFYVSE